MSTAAVGRSYWRLTFHSNTPDMRHIVRHDVDWNAFDAFELRRGRHFSGHIPSSVRLWVPNLPGPLADHLANMLGWPIVSDRLLRFLWPMIQDCVQVLPAPVYVDGTEQAVQGYSILNVTRVCDCVDFERSTPWYDPDGTIGGYHDPCIVAERTGGAHMFKYSFPPSGVDLGVICSVELVQHLTGRGFTGLAFIRCCSAGEDA